MRVQSGTFNFSLLEGLETVWVVLLDKLISMLNLLTDFSGSALFMCEATSLSHFSDLQQLGPVRVYHHLFIF